ncbi:hypothetical protein [[Eubacterium] cellulosolvens]
MNTEIIVDGERLEINDFVKKVTYAVATGLVNSLRDVPEWSTIEIKLEK